MPAYNFQARFSESIKNLEKRQTIRARGKRPPPKIGDRLVLYTGMRTSNCKKLLDTVCTSVELITIHCTTKSVAMPKSWGNNTAWLDLDQEEVEALAKADGFKDSDDMFAWFAENHGRSFSGALIKW